MQHKNSVLDITLISMSGKEMLKGFFTMKSNRNLKADKSKPKVLLFLTELFLCSHSFVSEELANQKSPPFPQIFEDKSLPLFLKGLRWERAHPVLPRDSHEMT